MLEKLVSNCYSEFLSRIPDIRGFKNWTESGLNASQIVRGFACSQEYANFNLNNAARVETLYRAVLGRNPDLGGFYCQVNYLNVTGNFNGLIEGFVNSTEFKARDFNNPGFNVQGVKPVAFNMMLQSELETKLNSGVKEIKIAPQTLVELDHTLIIPTGVSLTTDTSSNHYVNFLHLVRNSNFQGSLVELENGSTVTKVWISGNTNRFPGRLANGHDVTMESGENSSTLANNRLDGSQGYTHVWIPGASNYPNYSFSSHKVLNNFIVGDETSYYNNNWSDGISNAGENTLIVGNQILNATDVGLINFSALQTNGDFAVNRSQVYGNTIVNTVNNAYGGLAIDAFYDTQGGIGDFPNEYSRSFEGFSMHDNVVWTSNTARLNVTLALGTRLWQGDITYTSTGGYIHDNNSGEGSINSIYGTIVSGALNVNLEDNDFTFNSVQIERGADLSRGYASGCFDYSQYLDSNFDGKLFAYC